MVDNRADVLTLTAEIVSSYVGNASHVSADQIPQIIRGVREALSDTGPSKEPADAVARAAKMHGAQVKKSITPDALISFIDNKPYKTLKPHLSRHGHDMRSYREAYGLPDNYPSVAASYSAARSELAKKIGLGARGKNAPKTKASAAAERGRKAAE